MNTDRGGRLRRKRSSVGHCDRLGATRSTLAMPPFIKAFSLQKRGDSANLWGKGWKSRTEG